MHLVVQCVFFLICTCINLCVHGCKRVCVCLPLSVWLCRCTFIYTCDAHICLIAGWELSGSVYGWCNSTSNSVCWCHAELYCCDSTTSPCVPTAWCAYTPLSSKLHSIWPLLFSILCSSSGHPPIFSQWCISSSTSGWWCISSSTQCSCCRSQIFTSIIQAMD